MPSVAKVYESVPISAAQLRRLYAIAYGTKYSAGALGGTKRDKANQLWEIVQRYGYDDWDCVDQNADPKGWLHVAHYNQIIEELEAMKGARL